MPTSDILARVKSTGIVSADDALAVRRAVYGNDTIIDRVEIETMLQIDEAAYAADPTWTALVAEAGADYLVHQEPPAEYLSQANADWLLAHIAADGVIKTPREFEMLVHVLEEAITAPCSLAALALGQVKMAILEGKGPLAINGVAAAKRVTRDQVDVLRRILYAFAGKGGVAISRDEAEVLFDLNDAVAGAANDPSWDDLFVKAMANFLMAACGYHAPPREVALERAKWLDAPASSVGGFMGKMVAGGLSGILAAYRTDPEMDQAEQIVSEREEAATAATVTDEEAGWLASRLGRDGRLTENEKALLKFIREQAPSVPPAIAALIEKAA